MAPAQAALTRGVDGGLRRVPEPASAWPSRRNGLPGLPAGWPLSTLLIGFPLWWAFGMTEVMCFAAAIVMTLQLARHRRIEVPRGFGVWLLFLAWVVVGVLVVQVDTPGAVPGGGFTRYLTGSFRLTWYLRATVVLLYVITFREELTLRWLTRTFAWMFVTITVGGLVGLLAPHLSFPSLLEVVLPSGVRTIPFVRSLIHPVSAELQNAITGNMRPSAPFTYANEWGFNFACFLPFFLLAWCGKDAGWRRVAAPFVLAGALVPVIFSLNRGLWAALITVAVFVALRYAFLGRFRAVVILALGAAVAALAIFSTPLGATIDNRLANGNSDEGRTTLALLGLTTMGETSPIVGLGTTRQVQGGFESIAQGATPTCPRCSPPSLGTQGQFSLVAFSQGFGGLVLYFGFLVLILLRHIRIPTAPATVGLSVILVSLATAPVYGADNFGLIAVMAGVGILVREEVAQRQASGARPGSPAVDGLPTLRSYVLVLRRHPGLLTTSVLLGIVLALVIQSHEGTRSIASVAVLLPKQPTYLAEGSAARTPDTEAQLASSTNVIKAISGADGRLDNPHGLTVSAVPNSRILNLTYSTTAGSGAARAGVNAAANAVLQSRGDELESRQSAVVKGLQQQAQAFAQAIEQIDRSRADLGTYDSLGRPFRESKELAETRYRLRSMAGQIDSQISRATSLPLEIGHTLGTPVVTQTYDDWMVSAAGGLVLGLTGGVMLALVLEARSSPLRRRRAARELPPGLRLRTGGPDRQLSLLRQEGVSSVLSVDNTPESSKYATSLEKKLRAWTRDEQAKPPGSRVDPPRVVLVATAQTRTRELRRMYRLLRELGADVVGVVLSPHQNRQSDARS